MKIAFFDMKKWEIDYLKSKIKGNKLMFFEEHIDDLDIKKFKDVDAISVFITSPVDKKIISSLSKLKLIATRSTGFDHIDLKECKKKKILVSNVPFYGENTVAEHAFALLLSLSRNIHRSYLRTQKDDFSIEGLTGFDLKDKTLGIIGGGHIGVHMAKMARGFDMNVLVYDINQNEFLSDIVGFQYAELNELLKKSDVVSLHLPYNKHTHHLIGKKEFSLMKKDSYLINTSRGGIVDTEALYNSLRNGKLAGAGLDVIEGENLVLDEKELLHRTQNEWNQIVTDHKIFDMPNVIFTPHNAFNSKEALIRILNTTIENIILNKESKNVVV